MTDPRQPLPHHYGMTGDHGAYQLRGSAAALILVKRAEDLPAALNQHELPIVIDDHKLSDKFSKLAYWQEARWWFISSLVAALLAWTIAKDYKLEFGWQHNWRTHLSNGKITLTPRSGLHP